MNDRLKELMLEAGYAAPEIAGRAQKLAELLIYECIEQVYPRWIKDHDHVDPTNLADAVMRIKEQFGVS